MKIADRIGLEFAFGRGFAFDLGQPGDPVALQTPVKGRARQMRDGGLQGIQAVVERQQGVLAEGNDGRFLLGRQHRGANDLGSHRRIVHEGPLAPLGDRLLVEPVLCR